MHSQFFSLEKKQSKRDVTETYTTMYVQRGIHFLPMSQLWNDGPFNEICWWEFQDRQKEVLHRAQN